ncbi:MAG: GPI anchored serine-threonine rich family protein [Spirochaetes bacterium]|nr:GPI anchored serine-threonine rich family protein [Spirochaetota bacterium]
MREKFKLFVILLFIVFCCSLYSAISVLTPKAGDVINSISWFFYGGYLDDEKTAYVHLYQDNVLITSLGKIKKGSTTPFVDPSCNISGKTWLENYAVPNGNNYKLKFTSTTNSSIYAFSDYFTIRNTEMI